MRYWFIRPLGANAERALIGGHGTRPVVLAGEYVCRRCGQPLVPCDVCGNPALCGDARCELCQPDG
jgi:hypothetical protein